MSHTIRKLMISAFLALTMNACLAAPTPEGAHRQEANTVQAGHYITSQQELTTYLHTTPNSPLDRLPADTKQRFLKSLIFGENGLASYEYDDLMNLDPQDSAQILGLFRPMAGKGDDEAVLPHDVLIDWVCAGAEGGCVGRQNHACDTMQCHPA